MNTSTPFTMSMDKPSSIPRDAFTNHRQMLHRLSTHSSNTSNSSRRGSARVTKITPSNSPHNVQRRRTNPTHTTRSFPRMAQESPYWTRDQRLRNYYSQYPMEVNRPMSWHPGAERLQTVHPPIPVHDPALGTAIHGLENLAVTGTPQPSVEQSIQDAFSLAYGFPMSQTPTDYMQPGTFPQTDPSITAISNHLNQPFPTQYTTYEDRVPTQHPTMTQDPSYDMYGTLSDYGLPQQAQTQLDLSSPAEFPYQAPNEMAWQNSVMYPQDVNINPKPRLQRKKSKELVGLGLYDDKKEDFISTLTSESNRESLGKDLKLEETWQPPKDDDEEEEEEEEAYSSDDAEEVPEEPNFINPAPAEPPTFYPAYSDLSNQSFFFNDDDQQLGHDDPYVNYVAFGSEGQPKVQPVAGVDNFMWI